MNKNNKLKLTELKDCFIFHRRFEISSLKNDTKYHIGFFPIPYIIYDARIHILKGQEKGKITLYANAHKLISEMALKIETGKTVPVLKLSAEAETLGSDINLFLEIKELTATDSNDGIIDIMMILSGGVTKWWNYETV